MSAAVVTCQRRTTLRMFLACRLSTIVTTLHYFLALSLLCLNASPYELFMHTFLADHTIGRAFGTLCRLSVCRL